MAGSSSFHTKPKSRTFNAAYISLIYMDIITTQIAEHSFISHAANNAGIFQHPIKKILLNYIKKKSKTLLLFQEPSFQNNQWRSLYFIVADESSPDLANQYFCRGMLSN